MSCFLRLSITLLFLSLLGCSSGQYYQYNNELEQPSGPGLLSGQDGEFSITPE
ncbi:hypothetical protein [Amphritea balenae]|uniref:hypothetical protein n=1 Tax=Amphritea balenae TaxID=452629 RepID=UPI0014761181|nr:hypothetical protein [Amphritea balenae]